MELWFRKGAIVSFLIQEMCKDYCSWQTHTLYTHSKAAFLTCMNVWSDATISMGVLTHLNSHQTAGKMSLQNHQLMSFAFLKRKKKTM